MGEAEAVWVLIFKSMVVVNVRRLEESHFSGPKDLLDGLLQSGWQVKPATLQDHFPYSKLLL